jgi:two-component system response regulator MprA
MRVLLIEDDREVAEYLRWGLEEEHNAVTVQHDGTAALRSARGSSFDIIVLDVMLPFVSGLEVTRKLRADGLRTPILLLTARDAPEDIVRGLDAGADDYLTKPFSFEVLLARLRARTRTHAPGPPSRFRMADLELDTGTREVWRGRNSLTLTRTEFSILECLIQASGRVVSRQQLIEAVWGAERSVESNTLDVFIRFLRSKIDTPGRVRLIHTVRGVGYSLREMEL